MLEVLRQYEAVVSANDGQDVRAIVDALRRDAGRGFLYVEDKGDGEHILQFTINRYSDHPACMNAMREAGLSLSDVHELEAQHA